MDHFSPRCPKCQRNDKVEIYFNGKALHLDKYYCTRCSIVFKTIDGYPEMTASFYQVTGSSISGADYFIASCMHASRVCPQHIPLELPNFQPN